MIRLALAAVLAHHEARYRLEDFAGAHDRTLVELRRGDGALAGRRGDAHEVCSGVFDIGDVAKRSGYRHDDIGTERKRQDDVGVHRRAVRHADRPSKHTEVERPERELGDAAWDVVKTIRAGFVGSGGQLARVHNQVDGDARKGCTRLIEDATASSEVRHVVAWLQPVRWITCVALWAFLAIVWLFPHLDLSLRSIGVLGLAAAVCRTLVFVTCQMRGSAPSAFLGLAFASDAVLLTGLLDITGGPFNPFIVMYAAYVWAAAVVVSPAWAAAVSGVSLAGFGWLVVDHLQAG